MELKSLLHPECRVLTWPRLTERLEKQQPYSSLLLPPDFTYQPSAKSPSCDESGSMSLPAPLSKPSFSSIPTNIRRVAILCQSKETYSPYAEIQEKNLSSSSGDHKMKRRMNTCYSTDSVSRAARYCKVRGSFPRRPRLQICTRSSDLVKTIVCVSQRAKLGQQSKE